MSDMLEVYTCEIELKKLFAQNCINKNNYYEIYNNYFLRSGTSALEDKYLELFKKTELFNFTAEDKNMLYFWAKNKRKELGLKDNLFNISEYFIDDETQETKLKEINEQINSSKHL